MSKSNWGDTPTPDKSHATGPDAAHAKPTVRDDFGRRRRSILPDPLTVLIAAESGLPILVPIFGANAYGPGSPCPHRGPIPDGSPHYCPQCHDTGLRDHPLIRLEPGEAPEPNPGRAIELIADPKIKAKAAAMLARPPKPLTRTQRRALEFGAKPADVSRQSADL